MTGDPLGGYTQPISSLGSEFLRSHHFIEALPADPKLDVSVPLHLDPVSGSGLSGPTSIPHYGRQPAKGTSLEHLMHTAVGPNQCSNTVRGESASQADCCL